MLQTAQLALTVKPDNSQDNNWLGRVSSQRREIKVRLLLRRILSLPCVGLQLFESCPAFISCQDRIRVKEGADWVSAKILGCAYPFRRGGADLPCQISVNLGPASSLMDTSSFFAGTTSAT
jgi:hypothetical protein